MKKTVLFMISGRLGKLWCAAAVMLVSLCISSCVVRRVPPHPAPPPHAGNPHYVHPAPPGQRPVPPGHAKKKKPKKHKHDKHDDHDRGFLFFRF